MQKIILYIQPQLTNTTTAQDYVSVDMMEEDLISLTQVIQDVKNIDKIFTDYSQTFNLPASKTNNKIFKWWYNPDVEGFDNQLLANARIELNHFAFKEGKIRLESVTMRNNQPSMYKVTFFGNTITLNDLIGEDKLNQLEWLNNFDHINNTTNVKNGLQSGLNFTVDSVLYTKAIIYPLIAHSQQYIYDATSNTDSGLNISTHSSHHTKRGVLPEDLKPAILIKNIIKAIEEKYALTFKTGEFFDSTAMDNLYMWLHREKGKLALAGTWVGNSNSYTCSGANCSELTASNASPRFTLGSGIIYYISSPNANITFREFTIDFQVTPNTGFTTVPYTIELVNASNWSTLSKKTNQIGTSTISYTFEDGEYFQGNIVGRVTTESSFEFQAQYDLDHTISIDTGSTVNTSTSTATFTSTANNLTPQSGQIIITDQMPEMKVLDFLTNLFKMYNLTAFVDFNGEIVVKKLNDFFAGGDTQNITEYVKNTEHSISKTTPYNEIDLEYAEPKSILAQTFLNTNNRKYGELEYKSDSKEGGAYKVTVPFEHMLFSRLSDLTALTNTDIQTGCFLDDDLNPSIGQPLVFYGVYRTGISTGINFLSGTTRPATYGALCAAGTNSTITSYWMPHHANELGSRTTPPNINLNFGSEIDTYNLTDYGGNNNSLFQENYEDYITNVYSKKARLYKFSAVLPLKVLLQLTLDDKIIIGTRLYKINSMTTKLQSGETEFELINDV